MQIDNSLIKACVSQNRKAQKQLYESLLPYLRAIACRYLKDTSYVKDVLQESFVKIFKSMDQYDFNKAPLKHWAARITINHCLNYNKRVIGAPKEEFTVASHDAAMIPAAEQGWTDEKLLFLLKKMPEGYFEVFNLFVIDGYSHQEIADLLGVHEALSRKRLSRAKNWLKTNFTKKMICSTIYLITIFLNFES